ncbi:remorin-like [Zingiber officinale]|uniref:remorin-like n=1 Tax=Zingiber officinale TaxID=94328 RepID=UPI001C4C65A3|nr:remorin-like [Zingiber officinale]
MPLNYTVVCDLFGMMHVDALKQSTKTDEDKMLFFKELNGSYYHIWHKGLALFSEREYKTIQVNGPTQSKLLDSKIREQEAEYAEKMKNKITIVHKAAKEKRAMTEAMCREELLKSEESVAKYHATGQMPKQGYSCHNS